MVRNNMRVTRNSCRGSGDQIDQEARKIPSEKLDDLNVDSNEWKNYKLKRR